MPCTKRAAGRVQAEQQLIRSQNTVKTEKNIWREALNKLSV